jgi:hypothetical protein
VIAIVAVRVLEDVPADDQESLKVGSCAKHKTLPGYPGSFVCLVVESSEQLDGVWFGLYPMLADMQTQRPTAVRKLM